MSFLDLSSSTGSRAALLQSELLKSKNDIWAAEKSNICYSEDAWWSGPDRSDVFQDFLDATSKKFPIAAQRSRFYNIQPLTISVGLRLVQ